LNLFILESDVGLGRFGVTLNNDNFWYSSKEAVKEEEELVLDDPP
jgi:hypothetical protein